MTKTPKTPDQLISAGPAAAILGVSPSTLTDLANAGRIPCVKTAGGHRRYRLSDLQAYLAAAKR
jgi:excisionase family DNA binding protein